MACLHQYCEGIPGKTGGRYRRSFSLENRQPKKRTTPHTPAQIIVFRAQLGGLHQ